MIGQYVNRALRRAHYTQMDDGTFCATVSGWRGIIATGSSLEECRDQLAETIEEWVLVRLARGLAIPALDGHRIVVWKTTCCD